MSWITVNTDVDIDFDDILYAMTSTEKQKLADELYEDGYVPSQVDSYDTTNEFDLALQRLQGNSWRLTREEEQFVISLGKRYAHNR